jgi:hypothetical protein
MRIVLQTGLFQIPDRPDFGQKPVRILNERFLSFGNPPLNSMACVKTQKPDCPRGKTILGFDYFHSITISYAKTQKPVFPPPKGEGVLPAKGGEDTSFPWARLGLRSWCAQEIPETHSSDDGGRYRQASTAVVFHPNSQPEEETTHG